VRDQTQLWADSYEREIAGILALQSEVARKVAGSLALKLLPAEEARLANVHAVNPEAYEACLKGSQYWIKMTKGDLDTAERYFEFALQKDPGYAPAHAGLAWVWACRNQMGISVPAEAVPKMKAEALKAVSLDDTLAEAHYALAGLWTWHDWNLAAAEQEMKRAVELDPNYPDGLAMYSHFLMIMGRPDEAMAQIERALKLDPFNVTIHSFYVVDLVFVRRNDDAIAQARETLKMQPDNFVALPGFYMALAAKGINKEAVGAVKDYLRIYQIAEVDAILDRGFAQDGFRGAMKCAAEALGERARQKLALPTDVATLYIYAEDRDRALEWLERAYEARDPNMPYIKLPVYDPLRSDPRFQNLMRPFRRIGPHKGSAPNRGRTARAPACGTSDVCGPGSGGHPGGRLRRALFHAPSRTDRFVGLQIHSIRHGSRVRDQWRLVARRQEHRVSEACRRIGSTHGPQSGNTVAGSADKDSRRDQPD
jgi:Tfp pilus assembly protein PilF